MSAGKLLEKMVEEATAEVLMEEDWEKNLALCDVVTMYPEEVPKEIAKLIRKRILHKNPKVQTLALALTETLVKNCSFPLHKQIAGKDFQKALIKAYQEDAKKRNGRPSPVGEKILSLVQEWAEAFGRFADTLPGFQETFNFFSDKHVEFPARNMDAMVPIHTPPVTHPTQQPSRGSNEPFPSGGAPMQVTPDRLAKLRGDLDQVGNQMKVFHEIMSSCEGPQQVLESEICSEMRSQAIEMKKRLVHLIENFPPEEILSLLIEVNDQTDFAIERYEKIVSGQPDPYDVMMSSREGATRPGEDVLFDLEGTPSQDVRSRAPDSLDELFSAATVSGGVGSHASSGISAVSGARGLPNEGRNYDAGAGADEFDEIVSRRRRSPAKQQPPGVAPSDPFADAMALPSRGPELIPRPSAPAQERPAPPAYTNPVASAPAASFVASSSSGSRGGREEDSDEDFDSFLSSRVSSRKDRAQPAKVPSDSKQAQLRKGEEDFFGL